MFKKLTIISMCIFLLSATFAFAEDVYVTSSGKKYHTKDCPLIVSRETKAISIEEAEAKGLSVCSKCIGKLQANEQLTNSEDAVYATKSGKKYHKQSCSLIKNKETNATSLKEAQAKGLEPCGKCFKEDLAKTETK